MKIVSISPLLVSSPYGDGNVLGQLLGVKTLGFTVEIDNGQRLWRSLCCYLHAEIFRDVAIIFHPSSLKGIHFA